MVAFVSPPYIQEFTAKYKMNQYYHALIDQNYEKAQRNLYYFYSTDESWINEPNLMEKEKLAFFLEKTKYLEEKDYRVIDYQFKKLEWEDGAHFFLFVNVQVEVEQEVFTWKDVFFIKEGKLIVTSDDPYIYYRNSDIEE